MAGVNPSRQDNRTFLFDGAAIELGSVPWYRAAAVSAASFVVRPLRAIRYLIVR